MIEIKVKDSELEKFLREISKRCEDLLPVMKGVAGLMHEAVEENFEQQGRPTKWRGLSQVTIRFRKRRGYWPGKILQMRGELAASITEDATKNKAVVGTNKAYAAVHQFGAKKGSFGEFTIKIREHMRRITHAFGKPLKKPRSVKVREHTRRVRLPWGDIPARPYLVITDEDIEIIKESIADFIQRGKR